MVWAYAAHTVACFAGSHAWHYTHDCDGFYLNGHAEKWVPAYAGKKRCESCCKGSKGSDGKEKVSRAGEQLPWAVEVRKPAAPNLPFNIVSSLNKIY